MNRFINKTITTKLVIWLTIMQFAVVSYAQTDTLRLPLSTAETRFLDSNLNLLAARYNIDASRAAILQARLWPNPNFGIGHALYSGSLKQFFPLGVNDETTAGIAQLVQLAGKRNKQIKLAEANATLSEYQFFDLLRTLKYQLRTSFYNVYYLQQSQKVYLTEIASLQQISDAFQQQEGKGYIAEKEVVRIKAQLYSFKAEYSQLRNQILDLESDLRLILRVKPQFYILPLADTTEINTLNPDRYTLNTLLDSAYNNRTDLAIAKTNSTINRLNYNYQKAVAVPDLSLSLNYDEQGSFLTNYFGAGVNIDLPFFNRNQGNIKQAKSQIQNTDALQKNVEETVAENVSNSLQKAYVQDSLYKSIDKSFAASFSRLLTSVTTNYQNRNLSLLEFLDFYDSYKQNMLQMNAIQYNRTQAFEDINFYTGTSFF